MRNNLPLRLFEELRALRAFGKRHLDVFSTAEDHHLIGEIGYHQAKGKPLTLKQLFLLGVGSIATVQRRLRRLKELGLVQHRRSARDRRAVELTLSPKCMRVFAKYETLTSSKPSARANGEPRHVCGLCDSDAGRRNLIVAFLGQGLKRGDRCLLVAAAEVQSDVVAELRPRQKAPEQLVVSEGKASSDAQFAFLKRVSQEAKQAGQTIRIAGEMSWTLSRNLRFDAVVDLEMRFDALARQLPLECLCVYDARRFSSGEFLRAVKCHRDHSHHPIVLG